MPKTVRLTKQDVVRDLRNVLDLDEADSHDEFDMFLGAPIEDPYLESICKGCLELLRVDPGAPDAGKDINEKTEQWVRGKIRELQAIK